MPTRQRVQDAVAAYVRDRNITNAVTAQVSTASRTTVSSSYFDQMRNAEIIVTVNPAYWEGDFRLWEVRIVMDHSFSPSLCCIHGICSTVLKHYSCLSVLFHLSVYYL